MLNKEFTIKSLYSKLDPERVGLYYHTKVGMGTFRGWELWVIRKDNYIGNMDVWYMGKKENLVICDETFTNILEYIDKDTKDSI